MKERKKRSLKEKKSGKKKRREDKTKFFNENLRCQVITHNGERCSRRAENILDLTEGFSIKGIKLIPKIDCCFFCNQHLKIIIKEKTYELLLRTYFYLLSRQFEGVDRDIFNMEANDIYRQLENIKNTGNKWGIKI